MRLLLIVAVVAALAIFGYQEYSQRQQAAATLEQEQQRFQQDKAALEAAQASNDLLALNQFIIDHPESAWLERAIFYRDQLAYRLAVDENTIQAMDNFITAYPTSQWRSQAEQRITRLQREHEQRQERERKEALLAGQRRNLQQRGTSTPGKATDSGKRTASSYSLNSGNQPSQRQNKSSTDRVTRALAIYQKQRDQEKKARYNQQQQRAREDEIAQRCHQIRDQLKQYERRNVRWYELDTQGERTFLSKQQVAADKLKLESQYREYCQN